MLQRFQICVKMLLDFIREVKMEVVFLTMLFLVLMFLPSIVWVLLEGVLKVAYTLFNSLVIGGIVFGVFVILLLAM